MKKTSTWLPIFQGFYGTIFDVSEDDYFLSEDIRELFTDNKDLQEKAKDYYYQHDFYEDIKEANNYICRECCNVIEKELQDLGIIKSLEMEKMVSPREYNFYNDSINIEIRYTRKNLKNIRKIITDNYQAWTKYLQDNYTSYDGFWSSHDNNPDSEEWQIEKAMQDSHNAGAIFQFILKELNGYDAGKLWESIADRPYLMLGNLEKFKANFLESLGQ